MLNERGDRCPECLKYVEAGQGTVMNTGRVFRAFHKDCASTWRRKIAGYKTMEWPLSRIAPIATTLRTVLEAACVRIQIAGSIRRGSPVVSDIELVAIPKIELVDGPKDVFGKSEKVPFNLLFQALDGFVGGNYIKGEDAERYRSFWWPVRKDDHEVGKVKVDLFCATPQNWGLIYTIRTGPGDWSRRLVTDLAKHRTPSHAGYLRDAKNVEPQSTTGGMPHWSDKQKDAMAVIPTPEERDVFSVGGIPWVPIVERRG